MKILSIFSHKGGAGKTTSAVMLAEDLAARGVRVVLVDADRQRGAGLLLGIEQPDGGVQQTRNPRLRYFCSSGMPLRELRAKADELSGLFDAAVVDTPSLDDPLAKTWLQLSTAALMVVPVEPVSLKTLDGADAAVAAVQRLNPQIRLVGTLPTMFDETDATQRSLLMELMTQRPDGLLPTPIPLDPGLAHRAEQKAERRTEASAASLDAYAAAADRLYRHLDLGDECGIPAAPLSTRPQPSPAAVPPAAPQDPFRGAAPPAITPRRRSPALAWAFAAVAILALLAVGIGLYMKPLGASTDGTRPRPVKRSDPGVARPASSRIPRKSYVAKKAVKKNAKPVRRGQ